MTHIALDSGLLVPSTAVPVLDRKHRGGMPGPIPTPPAHAQRAGVRALAAPAVNPETARDDASNRTAAHTAALLAVFLLQIAWFAGLGLLLYNAIS